MIKNEEPIPQSDRIDAKEVVIGPDRGLSGREYTCQTTDLGGHHHDDEGSGPSGPPDLKHK